jgi:GTP-sensing pleiotropic transcriptional regulator CodY
MSDKYRAVVELRTKDNKTTVLRFHSLSFSEAKAFQKLFDKFDHIYSDADLVMHMWEQVGEDN